ncbi:Ca2+-binding RTX toxin-like protein [Bradyrhizobium sp. LB7.2]
MPEAVTIANAEAANDRLVIQALGGNDVIDASLLAAAIGLTIDGGAGNDTITGSQGADTLIGGDGNDNVTGGRGNDVALLGAGDDIFTWNPGDGSDTVFGDAGTDTLVFNGSNVAENMSISANGGHALLTRDVAAIVMDLDGIERVQIAAAGGADNITVKRSDRDRNRPGCRRPQCRPRQPGWRRCGGPRDRERHDRCRQHIGRDLRRIDRGQRPRRAGDDCTRGRR